MTHATTLRSDRTADLLKTLEAGVREVFSSGKYTEYLRFLGRFHKYSWSNALLIQLQCPNASHVAGYNAWLKLGRTVNKGEHGIKILAPSVYRKPVAKPPDDPASDASSAATRAAAISVRYFRTVSVFDIFQTTGAPLPELARELVGDVPDFAAMLQAIRDVSNCPIEFGKTTGGTKGYFAPAANRIVVKKGMSEMQIIKTLLHEVAHERLHRDTKESRSTAEVEAESTACVTMSHFGFDTSGYSFGYLASWSSDEQLAELRKSLPVIQKASNALVNDLEAALAKNASQHRSVAA